MTPKWTARAPLPGGDFPVDGVPALTAALRAAHPYLTPAHAARLIRAYGTEAMAVLGPCQILRRSWSGFRRHPARGRVRWLIEKEYARTRGGCAVAAVETGLRLSAEEVAELEAWMAAAVT